MPVLGDAADSDGSINGSGIGDLRYELKKAWRGGTRFVTLDPYYESCTRERIARRVVYGATARVRDRGSGVARKNGTMSRYVFTYSHTTVYSRVPEAFHVEHSGNLASAALAAAPRRECMAFAATSVRHSKPRDCVRGDARV